jgi:hypothetical protein
MTTEGCIIGVCDCATCNGRYDFEASGAEFSDQCPACAAREEAEVLEQEAREEAIADAQGDVDEAEADLEGLMEELRDVKERIAAARRSLATARRKLARLEGEADGAPVAPAPAPHALSPSYGNQHCIQIAQCAKMKRARPSDKAGVSGRAAYRLSCENRGSVSMNSASRGGPPPRAGLGTIISGADPSGDQSHPGDRGRQPIGQSRGYRPDCRG